jgi:secretion/DNA translocation related TadE-like protein
MSRPGVSRIRAERGSATIWVVSVAGVLAMVALAVGLRAAAVLARHRLEAGADAAALAAASQIGLSGQLCEAAAVSARSGGFVLVRCLPVLALDRRSGSVSVEISARVSVGALSTATVTAWARAGRDPP